MGSAQSSYETFSIADQQIKRTKEQEENKYYIISAEELEKLDNVDPHINNDIIFKSACIHNKTEFSVLLLLSEYMPSKNDSIIQEPTGLNDSMSEYSLSNLDVVLSILTNRRSLNKLFFPHCVGHCSLKLEEEYTINIDLIKRLVEHFSLVFTEDAINVICTFLPLYCLEVIQYNFGQFVFTDKHLFNAFTDNPDIKLIKYLIKKLNFKMFDGFLLGVMASYKKMSLEKYKLLFELNNNKCFPEINEQMEQYLMQLSVSMHYEWFIDTFKADLDFDLLIDALLNELVLTRYSDTSLQKILKYASKYIDEKVICKHVEKINSNDDLTRYCVDGYSSTSKKLTFLFYEDNEYHIYSLLANKMLTVDSCCKHKFLQGNVIYYDFSF